MSNRGLCAFLLLTALGACRQAPEQPRFPKADREVAPIVSDAFSTEDVRDRLGEAEQVLKLAGVAPGMWVADIGAGEGYYTVRLAPVVGRRGRVLAEDIVPEVEERLIQRVHRDNLTEYYALFRNAVLSPASLVATGTFFGTAIVVSFVIEALV